MLYSCPVSEVTKLIPGAVTLRTPQVQTVTAASCHVNDFPLMTVRTHWQTWEAVAGPRMSGKDGGEAVETVGPLFCGGW